MSLKGILKLQKNKDQQVKGRQRKRNIRTKLKKDPKKQ